MKPGRRCFPLFHRWEDVGVLAVVCPVQTCRRCGWHQVFTGFSTVLYPPSALRPTSTDSGDGR